LLSTNIFKNSIYPFNEYNLTQSRIYKISLLGEGGVGKTALRHRFLGEGFKDSYQMTIGADFAAKQVKVDGMNVVAQIWDLAGQERFETVRSVYYKGTLGGLLVFDITRPETYEIIANWVGELVKNNSDRVVPMALIGNKGDLRGQGSVEVDASYPTEYARILSDWSGYTVPYIETSALSGENVELAFETLIRNVTQYLEQFRTS
jgi:small GTP-binding protein